MKSILDKLESVIFYFLLILMIFICCVAVQHSISSTEFKTDNSLMRNAIVLNGEWLTVSEADSDSVKYFYRLPESDEESLWLCMKTYLSDFELSCDGKTIYTFTDDSFLRGRSHHMVKISSDMYGKQLYLKINSSTQMGLSGQGAIGDVYLGSKGNIISELLYDNMYALIFFIFADIVGLFSLVMAFWLRKSLTHNAVGGAVYFGLFVITTGIWVLTDSEMLLFVTDRISTVALISYISFMLLPAFLLKYVNHIFKINRIFNIICAVLVILAAAYALNVIKPLFPGNNLLIPTHVLCIFVIVLVMVYGIKMRKSAHNDETKWILIGFLLLSVSFMITLVMFYFNPISRYPVAYCIGFWAFIFCLFHAMATSVYGQIKEKAHTELYKRLAYTDVMTGMKNRSAFEGYIKNCEKNGSGDNLICVMFDINNLKYINDRYGHYDGDCAIISAASAIESVFGKVGSCFRIGGDEFAVFTSNVSETRIHELINEFRRFIASGNDVHRVEVAAGFARAKEGESADELFRRADAEMYRVKKLMKEEVR